MKIKKFKINLKGKKINLELKEMRWLNKALGLMVYRKSNLLFKFGKGRRTIHSWFCPKFIAMWLDNGKVIDIQLIKPWRYSIKPKKDYDVLIEIPITESNFKIVNFVVGKKKKFKY